MKILYAQIAILNLLTDSDIVELSGQLLEWDTFPPKVQDEFLRLYRSQYMEIALENYRQGGDAAVYHNLLGFDHFFDKGVSYEALENMRSIEKRIHLEIIRSNRYEPHNPLRGFQLTQKNENHYTEIHSTQLTQNEIVVVQITEFKGMVGETYTGLNVYLMSVVNNKWKWEQCKLDEKGIYHLSEYLKDEIRTEQDHERAQELKDLVYLLSDEAEEERNQESLADAISRVI